MTNEELRQSLLMEPKNGYTLITAAQRTEMENYCKECMIMTSAYFAGGCFWCIMPAFAETDGVHSVTSGYCGGEELNPVYDDVKHQRTGHRETIRIEYDESKVTFAALLELFLQQVDPFDEGGQFIDRGHSYTLAVYYTDEPQRAETLIRLAALSGETGKAVHIAVEPLRTFWTAEEEHQDYYLKHPAEFEQELIDSGRKPAPEA